MSLLLDLEADTLVLSDGDPVGTWADQSGNGYDFTASGSARPTYKASLFGYPAVFADGIDDYMTGPNAIDNPGSMTIIFVIAWTPGFSNVIISKITNTGSGNGWTFYNSGTNLFIQDGNGANWIDRSRSIGASENDKLVQSGEVISYSELHVYYNGNNSVEFIASQNGTVTNISTASPLRLFTDSDFDDFSDMPLYALRIYVPALSPTARAAAEAELGARYGVEPYLGNIFVSVNPDVQRAKGVRIYP